MSRETWDSLPKYAGGGMHGSMFIAGESGPEIVGHVNGRSEILNKSQLAQTMHSAIVNGMAQFVPYMSGLSRTVAAGTNAIIAADFATTEMLSGQLATDSRLTNEQMESMIANMINQTSGGVYGETADDIAEGVREGMYESTVKQNDLLKEQNELLRAIANKDTTVEISANAISRALAAKNSRDGIS